MRRKLPRLATLTDRIPLPTPTVSDVTLQPNPQCNINY